MSEFQCNVCGKYSQMKKRSYIGVLLSQKNICSLMCYRQIDEFENIIKESRWVTDNVLTVNKDADYE